MGETGNGGQREGGRLHRAPISQLPPQEKIRRQERHLQALTIVRGGICSVAVGTIIAVNTR